MKKCLDMNLDRIFFIILPKTRELKQTFIYILLLLGGLRTDDYMSDASRLKMVEHQDVAHHSSACLREVLHQQRCLRAERSSWCVQEARRHSEWDYTTSDPSPRPARVHHITDEWTWGHRTLLTSCKIITHRFSILITLFLKIMMMMLMFLCITNKIYWISVMISQ